MGTSSGANELNHECASIDYTINANHGLIKTTMSNKRYRTRYKI